MTFGERLKELREESGMSLEEVAQKVGLTRPTIYRYEKGIIKTVPPEKVHQLANLYGVTRPYLMGWTEKRHENPAENLDMVAEKQTPTLNEQLNMEYQNEYWKSFLNIPADCTTAATQAARALIKFNISRTPIYPQQILQASSRASVVTFGDPEEIHGICGTNVIYTTEQENLVWSSILAEEGDRAHYLFTVNRDAPIGKLKLALAIELGHIYLGHGYNVSGSEKAKMEAACFAVHLLFPRAVIQLLTERGVVLTKEVFSRVFGDCDWCLESILNAKPVRIAPDLNRLVKDQFTAYVDKLEDIGVFLIEPKGERLDFGNYMAGYEE